jgi:hypothetical protein
MDIRDHGDFVHYDPPDHPLKRHNVVFCKRISDGRDWYELARELRKTDTIKMTVKNVDGDMVVVATAHDASMLFPIDCKLIEVSGVTEAHEEFRNKRFDGKSFQPWTQKHPPAEMIDVLIEELGLDRAKLLQKFKSRNRRRDG